VEHGECFPVRHCSRSRASIMIWFVCRFVGTRGEESHWEPRSSPDARSVFNSRNVKHEPENHMMMAQGLLMDRI
jgi:hypothetical protein